MKETRLLILAPVSADHSLSHVSASVFLVFCIRPFRNIGTVYLFYSIDNPSNIYYIPSGILSLNWEENLEHLHNVPQVTQTFTLIMTVHVFCIYYSLVCLN